MLVTDGDPTLAPENAQFGPNPCQNGYDVNGSYADRGIFLYASLVAPATTVSSLSQQCTVSLSLTFPTTQRLTVCAQVFLGCFSASSSTIRQVGNFSSLGDLVGRIVGQLLCPIDTESPTHSLVVALYWSLSLLFFCKNK